VKSEPEVRRAKPARAKGEGKSAPKSEEPGKGSGKGGGLVPKVPLKH
jgi:hypothetical protein